MNFFLISSAIAQDAKAAAPGFNPTSLVPLLGVIAIFYFLMIRPQQKRMKEEESFLSKLNKGDEVFTKSGILGIIRGTTEKIITLEVAEGVKMKVLRGNIAGLSSKIFEKEEKK